MCGHILGKGKKCNQRNRSLRGINHRINTELIQPDAELLLALYEEGCVFIFKRMEPVYVLDVCVCTYL